MGPYKNDEFSKGISYSRMPFSVSVLNWGRFEIQDSYFRLDWFVGSRCPANLQGDVSDPLSFSLICLQDVSAASPHPH